MFSRRFSDGVRFTRSFDDLKTVHVATGSGFPTLTGAEWLMLFQLLPLIIQSGDGILSVEKHAVRTVIFRVVMWCWTLACHVQ